MKFKLHSNYQPRGDQPEAIEQLFRGLEAGDKHRYSSASPAPAKPSRWPRSSKPPTAPRWSWRTTKRSPRSSTTNSKVFFPKTPSNISSAITIITSPKPTSPPPTSTSKRIHHQRRARQAAHERHAFAVRTPRRHHRGFASPAFMASARPKPITACS